MEFAIKICRPLYGIIPYKLHASPTECFYTNFAIKKLVTSDLPDFAYRKGRVNILAVPPLLEFYNIPNFIWL